MAEVEESGQAGVLITPAMIEAGARILRDTFDAGETSAAMTAHAVFEAMASAATLDAKGG